MKNNLLASFLVRVKSLQILGPEDNQFSIREILFCLGVKFSQTQYKEANFQEISWFQELLLGIW